MRFSKENSITETFTYNFQQQRSISSDTTEAMEDSSVTVYDFSVEPGDAIVFTYKHVVTPPRDILDGGSSETLVFQIPAGSDSFELTDDRLRKANAFFQRGCFCQFAGQGFPVTGGTIRGQKISAINWFVEASITVKSPVNTQRVAFDNVFREK